MNKRYGAAMAGVCSLALLVAGCGSNDKADPGMSLPTMTPSATTPSAIPTPTPVDATTAAKTKVLAAYTNYRTVWVRGLVRGGANYRYEGVLTGGALDATNAFVAFHKGFRGTRFSGNLEFWDTKITSLNLTTKPATAIVRSCVLDTVKGISKAGKQVVTPAGRQVKDDELHLIKGRWLVANSDSTPVKTGECAR